MLWQRVISSVILIPIVIASVYFGGITLFAMVLLAGLVCGYEYLKMMRVQHFSPSYFSGLLLVCLLIVDAQWPQWNILPWGLGGTLLITLTMEVFHGNAPGSLTNWALALAGGLYIGFLIGHVLKLGALDRGREWLIVALVGTWICDTGAYFVGRSIGKCRFFPAISPKKTWEGAIGGLVTGMISVTLMAYFILGIRFPWGIILGFLLVLGAVFGDLAESVIKRQVGAKDSGNLIPGHGGLLDRVDSLLFVIPIVYAFALLVR
jgi:phosphatidate cytidylyltransferase